MIRIPFDRKWQIQMRTFADGKWKQTTILAETQGCCYWQAQELFERTTGLKSKEAYTTFGNAMHELGYNTAEWTEDQYKEAIKLMSDRNFIMFTSPDGKTGITLEIKRVRMPIDSIDNGKSWMG